MFRPWYLVCLTLKNDLSQYTGALVPARALKLGVHPKNLRSQYTGTLATARALKLGVHPKNLRSQYIPSYKGHLMDLPHFSYCDFHLRTVTTALMIPVKPKN